MPYKIAATFEKDGVTPKANTHKMDYTNDLQDIWNLCCPIVVGQPMLMAPADKNDDRILTTTRVEEAYENENFLRVTTRNTIYVIEKIKEDELCLE